MGSFILGVDLGQAQDYTALSIIQWIPPKKIEPNFPDYFYGIPAQKLPSEYHCRHLHRFPLGTRYPAIVQEVANLLNNSQIAGAHLVVDGTGVGRAVIDMFVEAGLDPIAITITGGDTVIRDGNYYRVPKRDLVGAVQVPLQDNRMKFAESLPLAGTLIDEMLNFKVKITDNAHDTYGSWREGIHDDLILSVMMAVWWIQYLEKNSWSEEAIAALEACLRWC